MARSNEIDLLRWFSRFIRESKNGKRIQKNGAKVREGTIEFYEMVMLNLEKFSAEKKFPLRIDISMKRSTAKLKQLQEYYKNFYRQFSQFVLEERNSYDNYLGATWKCIRTFFNWLRTEKLQPVGDFHKSFYTRTEKVPLVTLVPERLQFLAYHHEFRNGLPEHLRNSLEMFLIGCVTGLRFSDLSKLNRLQVENRNGNLYIQNTSRKTHTSTTHKLPDFAAEIMMKQLQKHKRNQLFLPISLNQFNKNLKCIAERAGWTEEMPKYRTRLGQQETVYKNKQKKIHFRFCDLVSSHCMRRTAITSLLCLGMNEMSVRMISGHAGGSKEFYRYVNFAKAYLDQEVDKAFEKLKMRTV